MKIENNQEYKINYGPYAKWDKIKAYSELSEKSFRIFADLLKDKAKELLEPINQLFYRMIYIAGTTSTSIRLINSWAFTLPAYALLRVRLEQTIVCSYLIYEDISIGLEKFLSYNPIGQFKGMRVAMEDESLREHLEKNYNGIERLKEDAIAMQKDRIPGFTYEDDKFERSWTNLNLRAIAHKRDLLAPKEPVIKHPLEREYISVYKIASSIVHAEADCLGKSFMNFYPGPDGSPVLMFSPGYAVYIGAFLAHYDILQCHEVLKRVEIPPGNAFIELMDRLIKLRSK
ncbi:MAG: DUF5677 domain-containing protein [Desulfobaccales bacterium]